MYNREQKEQFIKDLTTSDSYISMCVGAFELTEQTEKKYNKDICEFSTKEFDEAFEKVAVALRVTTVKTRINILHSYLRWCDYKQIKNLNKDLINHQLKSAEDMSYIMVKDPKGIQDFLDALYTPERDYGLDNVYRCLVWLIFMGVSPKSTERIKSSDVNLKLHSLQFEGKKYNIPFEALECFKICATSESFVRCNNNYTFTSWNPRYKSDLLLRGLYGNPNTKTSLNRMSMLNRELIVKEGYKLSLSSKKIALSGLFYRTKQREDEGYPVDFSQYADKLIAEKEYNTTNISLYAKKNSLCKQLDKDYKRWKDTFYKGM